MARDDKRIAVPQLFHGISRQPEIRRFPGQVTDAVNVVLSPVDGISKRPSSQWLSSPDANAPVSFSGASWTASTKTITKTGAFSAYTRNSNDYVYIRLNGADIRWGLYQIASKTSDDAIVLTEAIADTDQTGNVSSGWPTDANYRIHVINRDQDEKYVVLYGEGQVRIFDTSGREQIVRVSDAAVNYLLNWGEGAGVNHLSGCDADNMVLTTSDDYTLVANRGVVCKARATPDYDFTEKDSVDQMFNDEPTYTNDDRFYAATAGRGLPSGFYEYNAGSSSYAKLYCRYVGPVWMDYARYNNIDASGFGIDFIESDETEWNVHIASIDIVGAASMAQVATQFGNAITNALQALTSGSEVVTVEWEETANKGRFVITSPFNGAGSSVSGIYAYGPNDDQWALRYPFEKSTSVDGTGQVSGDLTLAERFTRVAVPGQQGAKPIQNTMPKALIRYTIGETDDGGDYYPGEWTLANTGWNARKSGSANSNPAPQLFQAPGQAGKDQDGMRIQDMAFHRGRLCIAAGEYLFFSQADDLFNFYIDDATNIVDSDPIIAQLSSNAVTVIEHLAPFRKSLLIFTKAGVQFELNTPDALTPSTAAVTTSTRYTTIKGLRPKAIGDFIYFMSKRADSGIVYEYFYDDTRVSNFANDVTSHVQSLLPVDIRSMDTSPNNNMVFIVPLDCQEIYVYFVWWEGNEKVQGAWARWTFDSSYRIIDIGCIENDLFMLVEDSTESILHIEKLTVQRQVL